MAISWSCANITKKVDPLVATTGKNRMCLSEFRGQVLTFHQNPDEPIDLRIPATNSKFEMIKYLRIELKRSSQKISKKGAETKNLEKSNFSNGSKRPIFRAIYYYEIKIFRQTILTSLILVFKQMCASISKQNKRPNNKTGGDSAKNDGPTPKAVMTQVGTTPEIAPEKFNKPRTRSEEKKLKLLGERAVTDSPGEDKGRSEDPEVVKGRLHQPKETPEPTSLMLQELPAPSSQGPAGTCSLESVDVVAKALTPHYVASTT